MKALILIIALIVIACLVYMIFQAFKAAANTAHDKLHGQWEVAEPDVLDDGTTQIFITKGYRVRPFGDPIDGSLPEYIFQEQLEDTKVRAQSRCDALNRQLTA